jgi:uncharacterized membrane protein
MTNEPVERGAAGARRAGNAVSGALVGIGVAAFVDETVFHQLLHWHHFYDRSTPSAGLFSDGLFHAFGWFAVVAGLFLLADLRRRADWQGGRWVGALLVGAGAFQLYDGTVQHKLLRLHQIRYHVRVAGYDWTWNVLAAVMIVVGVIVLRRRPPVR